MKNPKTFVNDTLLHYELTRDIITYIPDRFMINFAILPIRMELDGLILQSPIIFDINIPAQRAICRFRASGIPVAIYFTENFIPPSNYIHQYSPYIYLAEGNDKFKKNDVFDKICFGISMIIDIAKNGHWSINPPERLLGKKNMNGKWLNLSGFDPLILANTIDQGNLPPKGEINRYDITYGMHDSDVVSFTYEKMERYLYPSFWMKRYFRFRITDSEYNVSYEKKYFFLIQKKNGKFLFQHSNNDCTGALMVNTLAMFTSLL